ncbi:MAG: sigma-54-dependent transcriptional regulator [Thermodesulfobacteriota bacterium]
MRQTEATESGMKDAGGDDRPRVLLVDDDQDMLGMLVRLIGRNLGDCWIRTEASGEAALSLLDEWRPEVLVTDIKMPGIDGMELLARARKRDAELSVIMMTGYGNVELAVQALQAGAYDFIEKPFDKDRIVHSLGRCLERVRLIRENRHLQKRLDEPAGFAGFDGNSSRMRAVFELIRKVADTDVTVLVRGESGTGKELAARALHSLSSRASRRMITVNCPALPAEILESELFGHARGAFTGASQDKKGLFLEADGSTLLLDEIGDLPPALQTKLLRVLQEKEIMPLGQTRSIPVDVRVVASTNQDLEAKIRQGLFREDLFYRLNVVTITMPSLAERPEDIPVLAGSFLQRYAAEHHRSGLRFSPEAERFLLQRSWKGNVRELQNAVKRAVLLASEEVLNPADLGAMDGPAHQSLPFPASDVSLHYNEAKRQLVEQFSLDYLRQALGRHNGNVTLAAQASGMGRQSFQRLLRHYGLDAERYRLGE